MSSAFFFVVLFGFGAMSSFAGSLTGLGGGFILIPLLTIAAGLDIKDAIFFSLSCILWLSILRMHQNRETIRKHRSLVGRFVLFSLLGAGVAAFIGSQISSEILTKIFAGIMIILSLYLFWDQRNGSEETESPPPHKNLMAEGIFFCSGFLGGLLGIGGGIINVPVLHKLFKYPMSQATQLSFPFTFVASLTGLSVYLYERKEAVLSQSPLTLLALLMGTFAGSQLASKTKFSSSHLKLIFASLMGIIGIVELLVP